MRLAPDVSDTSVTRESVHARLLMGIGRRQIVCDVAGE
jgi:hypothetical protein